MSGAGFGRWGTPIRAEDDGEGCQAAKHQTVAMGPGKFATGDGEAQVREAGEQATEGDIGFEPGQRGAEAVVGSVAEREVPAGATGDVEAIRVIDQRRVAVGGTEADEHLLAGGKGDAVELDRFGRDPEGGVGNGSGEPQHLLDSVGEQGGVVEQDSELVGVVEQGDDAVADEAAGGVVAGHHELEERREHLGAGRHPSPDGVDENHDEITLRVGHRIVDKSSEGARDDVRGGDRLGRWW